MVQYVCSGCNGLVKDKDAVIRYDRAQLGGGTGIYVYCKTCYEILYGVESKK